MPEMNEITFVYEPPLSSEFQRKIANFFGMTQLNTDFHDLRDESGNIIDRFQPTLFWVVQTSRFRHERPGNKGGSKLTIAVVHTTNWTKGILLIQPIVDPFDRAFGGPRNLQPFPLNGSKDRVVAALKAIDLTYDSGYVTLDGSNHNFRMLIATRRMNAELKFNTTPGKNQNHDRLWTAISKTVYELVDLYDDPEINEFVGRKPRTEKSSQSIFRFRAKR